MKKKLYYVVEKQTEWIGQIVQELNGFKSIAMYSIEDNIPSLIDSINDVDIDDKSVDAIQNYLDDNGFADEDFDFIQL